MVDRQPSKSTATLAPPRSTMFPLGTKRYSSFTMSSPSDHDTPSLLASACLDTIGTTFPNI